MLVTSRSDGRGRVILRRKLVLEAIALIHGMRAIVVIPALGGVSIPFHQVKEVWARTLTGRRKPSTTIPRFSSSGSSVDARPSSYLAMFLMSVRFDVPQIWEEGQRKSRRMQ